MLNNHIAQFCNESGDTMIGSDSVIIMDGRWNQESRDRHARDMRERYRKHFPHKYAEMTHYIYKGKIRVADCY